MSGNVYWNKPTYYNNNVTISGDLVTNKITSLGTVNQVIINVSDMSTNVISLDYNLGNNFYIANSILTNANVTDNSGLSINILNLPSITNSTQKYVVNMTMKVPSTNSATVGPRLYGNSISVSSSAVGSSTYLTPKWVNGTSPDTSTWITSGMIITQQIEYMYQDESGNVLSAVNLYN